MQSPFIVGKKIYLRPIFKADISSPEYVKWMNDYEVTKYLGGAGVFPENDFRMEGFYERVVNSDNNVVMAIVNKSNDKHIGNIKLGGINWVHRRAEFSIVIGEKGYWGKGYGEEATFLTVNYGFKRLNLHKITLGAFAEHIAAIKTYEKVGFEREGLVKEAHFIDGKWHDRVIMGVTLGMFLKKAASYDLNH